MTWSAGSRRRDAPRGNVQPRGHDEPPRARCRCRAATHRRRDAAVLAAAAGHLVFGPPPPPRRAPLPPPGPQDPPGHRRWRLPRWRRRREGARRLRLPACAALLEVKRISRGRAVARYRPLPLGLRRRLPARAGTVLLGRPLPLPRGHQAPLPGAQLLLPPPQPFPLIPRDLPCAAAFSRAVSSARAEATFASASPVPRAPRPAQPPACRGREGARWPGALPSSRQAGLPRPRLRSPPPPDPTRTGQ